MKKVDYLDINWTFDPSTFQFYYPISFNKPKDYHINLECTVHVYDGSYELVFNSKLTGEYIFTGFAFDKDAVKLPRPILPEDKYQNDKEYKRRYTMFEKHLKHKLKSIDPQIRRLVKKDLSKLRSELPDWGNK